MKFVDFALTRLADPATRPSLFDDEALRRVLAAGYDTREVQVDAPLTAVFDDLSMGFSVYPRGSVEGYWGDLSQPHQHPVSLLLSAGGGTAVRVDALWRGSVVAALNSAVARIDRVSATWPDAAGIDAEIVADLGQLPPTPEALESERRHRFLARWRAATLQPEALTDVVFDSWLRTMGFATVSDLMEHGVGAVAGGPWQVGFSPATLPVTTRRPVPVAAAVLIRDVPMDLSGLLADSRTVRDALQADGANRPGDDSLHRRSGLIVIWIVPDTVFDDPDWPGGADGNSNEVNNAKRQAAASLWLSQEAIAVVALPAHSA